MKEKIMEAFQELGFQLEQIEETEWYGFSYEGNNYMYFYNSEDAEFLSISIPGIFELKDDNINTFIVLEELLNSTPKYVKAYKMKDSLWLFYERELLGEEDLKLVISHMIKHLDAALFTARKFIATMKLENETVNDEHDEQPEYVEVIDEQKKTDSQSNNEKQESKKTTLGNLMKRLSGIMKRETADTEITKK